MFVAHGPAQAQNSLMMAVLIAVTVAIFWRALIKIIAIGATILALLGLFVLLPGMR